MNTSYKECHQSIVTPNNEADNKLGGEMLLDSSFA